VFANPDALPDRPSIAHLGKAIAIADKGAAGTATGAARDRARMHAAYAKALIPARGYGAPETLEAFTRAREAAAEDTDTPARLAADHGLWGGSVVLGELAEMKAHATAFLRDVAARPDSPEAGVAHRIVRSTHWYAGEYAKREAIWNRRSPCSSRAEATIWRYASVTTSATAAID
jgi:hypothetical protein